ncbi:MAG TPA: type II toxin-antitoxin system VapC family toxin [Dehalococcoidia bacterium]|nr:type II toxin-antitoxin system VapC family toxin [Dehalococcoidia bacterium]
MKYLVDTDWLADYLAEDDGATFIDRLRDQGLALSVVTYMELYEGAIRVELGSDALSRLDTMANELRIVPVNVRVARRCAHIRSTLRAAGGRVRTRALDLIIAATAIEYGLTLVTRNERDYRDIPGLALYGATATAPED